ncbi:MAG: M56 family metallopeptidase [Thermoleophilia bacterium]
MGHRRLALVYFSTIIFTGMATSLMLALFVLNFLSSSLLVAMGDLCGGIFAASHDFLAANRWNYLLVAVTGAVFMLQGAFLIFGGARLFRATHQMKRLIPATGTRCPALASLAPGFDGLAIAVVDDEAFEARTVGLFRPWIMLSSAAVELLSSEELRAVIAHEDAHRTGRDNLLRAAARSVALAFFYLPGLKRAYLELSATLELAADDHAVATGCSEISVARTLARVVAADSPAHRQLAIASAAIGEQGGLERRLLNLAHSGNRSPYARRRLTLFAVVTLTAFAGFATSAFAVVQADHADALICYTEHQLADEARPVCDLDQPLQ